MNLARDVAVSAIRHVSRIDVSVPHGISRVVIGTILLLWVLQPDVASGGTYVMRSCNVPGHKTVPAAPWTWINVAGTYANDECASGGGFGVNAGPMQRVTAAGVTLEQPSRAITIRRVRLWMVARLSGSGSSLFAAAASDASGITRNQDLFGPPGGDTLTTPFESPLLAPDTGAYIVFVSCSGNTWDGCVPSSPNPLEIRGAEVTLQEDTSPTGVLEGGPLLDGAIQSGTRNLSYAISDQESGVASVSAMIGDKEVATQSFSAECRFSDFAACPRNQAGSLAVDTRVLSNGIYPVSLRIADAAGNRITVYAPRAVQISNEHTIRPNGQSATSRARLTAVVRGRRGTTVTVPYNRHVVIRGRLLTSEGEPINDAKLEVHEVPSLGRRRGVTREVITRSNGTYTYTSARRSTTRRLEIRYRPFVNETTIAAVARIRLNVAAAATLRVALKDIRVSYSGRVLSRPVPSGGKRIYVQGRAVGGAWTTFAHRRTDRSGRFSGNYRLRVRRPGVRLQFRIRIPKEAGYPYVASVGRAITRTVR